MNKSKNEKPNGETEEKEDKDFFWTYVENSKAFDGNQRIVSSVCPAVTLL